MINVFAYQPLGQPQQLRQKHRRGRLGGGAHGTQSFEPFEPPRDSTVASRPLIATRNAQGATMASTQMSGDVRITGVINDEEFAAEGQASGDPTTGVYEVSWNTTTS
ncbi:hypothetical protein GCM10017776_59610 [Streptomyces griseoluteus]|nr:hypothetical protein GCM10017776_59610 [Streptomyces griseoluteus]